MNFAVLGVGGYIAPRHLQAIQENGGQIVLVSDVHDSVGIIDNYGYNIPFVLGFDSFKQEFLSKQIDYVSICTPNHCHFEQIKWCLENGANVICEKPMVLYSWQIDELIKVQERTGKNAYTVLQLREHGSIVNLKNKVEATSRNDYELDLTYITSRGPWYHQSWKGNSSLSGGLPTNIGIHFFDMLVFIFGELKEISLEVCNDLEAKGVVQLERATVNWYLSVHNDNLPSHVKSEGKTTYRSIMLDGEEIEFSAGFTDLHNVVYKKILKGKGYGPEVAKISIGIVEKIRELSS